MQALINKKYDGRNLKLGRLLADYGAYKRYMITYRGDGLTISGVMNVPDGKGPFQSWCSTMGTSIPTPTSRARACRGNTTHLPGTGMSCCTRTIEVMHPLTTTRTWITNSDCRTQADMINAVKAVKSSKLKFLDKDRVGWPDARAAAVTLTALVAQPGLVDAAVIYASVSSLAADNWKQFSRRSDDRSRTNRRIARSYGPPDKSPEFWRAASPRPSPDRVTEPLLVHHGIQDDTCPIRWSESTVKALKGGQRRHFRQVPRGRPHIRAPVARSIERTVSFFDKHLD